ncbi:hypothetical protein CICLE_v10016887mg [Citrus x clementina]|uniref:Fiber protein Fb34 n=1 Tax=Citrus clementina TaxID=85681 RepID=V4TPT3_CITCL|nr:uncharacterized protein LOC18053330 [Citrus x clementina]ESR62533.1 hypothetical protein CICLE_v10016887mg [Citrus x clementina]
MASKLVLLLVFVLDLIAFGLAVAAEQRRSTAHIANGDGFTYCSYDKDIATGLGAGSFLFLLISQIVIMAASRCLCCGRAMRPSGARVWAIVLFITCWVFFLIAEICLLAGLVRNAYHTKYRRYMGGRNLSCETLRKGVFGAGAAFVVLTGIISELYYVSYSRANDGQASYNKDTGIRMGNL